ncbi:MAG: hypothetical protein WC628_09590 [Candidatus Omnitrophota bacterium]
MKGRIGEMNIAFSEVYNEEDDIYYVTFKTGEPSYCQEIDDILIIELGLFTNLPTGFRILNFSKNRVKHINFAGIIRKIQQTLHDINPPCPQDRQNQIRKALEEVLA